MLFLFQLLWLAGWKPLLQVLLATGASAAVTAAYMRSQGLCGIKGGYAAIGSSSSSSRSSGRSSRSSTGMVGVEIRSLAAPAVQSYQAQGFTEIA